MKAKKVPKQEIEQPTEQEIEAARQDLYERNIELLREARKIAAEAWEIKDPPFDQVAGVAEILERGIESQYVLPLLVEAIKEAKLAAQDADSVFALFDILADVGGEERLAEVKKLFPTESCEGVVEAYDWIYGEDEVE